MKKTEFIIFDLGGTLTDEIGWDDPAGERAVLRRALTNPLNVGPEEVLAEKNTVFRDIERVHDELGYDLPVRLTNRLAYGRLGLTFSLSEFEIECVMRDAISEAVPVPGARETLRELRERGIGTGVLSNNGWSGEAIEDRLRSVFPDHRFSFVMSSADYLIKKPDPRFFEIAVRKAGVDPSNIRFCGDHFEADVLGAHGAGLFPVFLTRGGEPPRIETKDGVRYLRIGSLTDVI